MRTESTLWQQGQLADVTQQHTHSQAIHTHTITGNTYTVAL